MWRGTSGFLIPKYEGTGGGQYEQEDVDETLILAALTGEIFKSVHSGVLTVVIDFHSLPESYFRVCVADTSVRIIANGERVVTPVFMPLAAPITLVGGAEGCLLPLRDVVLNDRKMAVEDDAGNGEKDEPPKSRPWLTGILYALCESPMCEVHDASSYLIHLIYRSTFDFPAKSHYR